MKRSMKERDFAWTETGKSDTKTWNCSEISNDCMCPIVLVVSSLMFRNLPADEAAAKLKADLKEFTDEYDAKKGPWTPQRIDHPEWKTKASWLHWDLNPCMLNAHEEE